MNTHDEITGTLENWFVREISPKAFIIWGDIYSDQKGRFQEGTHIHTSWIGRGLHDPESLCEGQVVQTTYSRYKLGKPLSLDDE